MPADIYTHGHHASVVGAHATRTIANSAAYLAPLLTPGQSLLDVGCGPGSITVEFAELLGESSEVLAFDLSSEVIDQARAAYPGTSARFETMDLYNLAVDDNHFDVAHAHQVLQHVSDPIAALREMKRVVKPGGVVAVRDADYAAMHWSPASPLLDRWQELYRAVAYANDAEPDAARHLVAWAREAGFTDVTPSVSTWLFTAPEGAAWWGGTWAQRIVSSSLADRAVELGLSSRDELSELSTAWSQWAGDPAAWFVVVHGELICRL